MFLKEIIEHKIQEVSKNFQFFFSGSKKQLSQTTQENINSRNDNKKTIPFKKLH